MNREPYVPPSLVAIAAHFECDWDPRVETFIDDGVAIGRRAFWRCVEHDVELASAEISRRGPVPSKEELDDAILVEIGRRALVEAAPEQMRDLSSEQLTSVARDFILGSLERAAQRRGRHPG